MSDRSGTSPVYVLAKDIPGDPTIFEICMAGEKIGGSGSIVGAQRIGALWRIYPISTEARVKLLALGLEWKGETIKLIGQNPFIVRGSDGEEIPATKLFIGDTPISYSNEELQKSLHKIGVVSRSQLFMEKIRDPNGKLTNWLSGRRYIWINRPGTPLPDFIKTGNFRASLYYKEKRDERRKCRKCQQEGHLARDCPEEDKCWHCGETGHLKRDCLKLVEEWMNDKNDPPVEKTSEESSAEESSEGKVDEKTKSKKKKRRKRKSNSTDSDGKEEHGRGRQAQQKGRIDYYLHRARSCSMKRKKETEEEDSTHTLNRPQKASKKTREDTSE